MPTLIVVTTIAATVAMIAYAATRVACGRPATMDVEGKVNA